MSKPIYKTERCKLFEDIAASVWARMIRAHEVNIDLKEIGVTSDILVDILQFSKSSIHNFDVYARPGWDENTYGSDIDVFVETDPNQYRWFALQAKILKKHNRYNTLRDSSNHIMQWEKLQLLEAASGCKAYYLLYNGRKTYTMTGSDLCNRVYNEMQLGCSLIEPNVIALMATARGPNGRHINPTFENLHPAYCQPWRILVCCYHDTENFQIYTAEQVYDSVSAYRSIEAIPTIDDNEELSENISKSSKDNIITAVSQAANWNPVLKIIIKRTDNLE